MNAHRIDRATAASLRSFLAAVSGRYDIDQAILFGSRARGTHGSDSDADLALVLRGNRTDPVGIALDLADVAYDVLLDTGLDISPLVIWEGEWRDPRTHSNPALLRNIANDGVRL